VSDHFEEWRSALAAHKSQFSNASKEALQQAAGMKVANSPVPEWFDVNARAHGLVIGTKYAQAYYSTAPLKIGNPMSLVEAVIPRP
jgi:hypothetical protein